MSQKAVKKTRVRNDFTETEEQDLVEFLADYDASSRTTIFPYRELTEKSYGSKHSAESWLSRYKRFRPIYDVRIEGFLLKNSLASHRANEDGESNPEPPKKKPRLQSPGSTPHIDEAFGNLPISFEHCTKNPSQPSQCDQWIGLNLAVNFICETYGVDPEVVYATWERSGNLTNTAAHFRDQHGNDAEMESPPIRAPRRHESDDVASHPAAGLSKRKRSSLRAISSADELPFLPTVALKTRVRSRTRHFHIEVVPTSEPGEGDDSSSASQVVMSPRHPRQNITVRSSPRSGHSTPVVDTHASDADDSGSEESDSSSEESKSDSEPSVHAPQLRQAPMPFRSDQPLNDAESESGSEASLSDQQVGDVQSGTDSASEASVQQAIPRPALPIQQLADDDTESGSESQSQPSIPHLSRVALTSPETESDSSSTASIRQPPPCITTDPQLNYESEKKSASNESDSDVEDAVILPDDPQAEEASQSENESEPFELFSRRASSEGSDDSNSPIKSSNDGYEGSYIPTQVSLFGKM
ncbi:hypothetical protein C8R45DRAFT_1023457 [Mycena sanguinolenta]|nr:hypothetical protein C8R45DRAFT_1023457 [Mycena sanguinolenta]